MAKNLVAYFSVSGNTARVAKYMAEVSGSDLYEIKAKIPYTKADLDYKDSNSRSSVEMQDPSSRPEIADFNANIGAYDTIFLGFPIWWYTAPTIVNTFLEAYDFSNKKSYYLLPAVSAELVRQSSLCVILSPRQQRW